METTETLTHTPQQENDMTPSQQSELDRVNQCLQVSTDAVMTKIAEIHRGEYLFDLGHALKGLASAVSDYEKDALVAHFVSKALKS